MPEIFVNDLYVYPIKSCAGISLEEMPLGPLGPEHDREFIVTRINRTMITQRTHPKLALVSTRLTGDSLIASAEDFGEVTIPLDPQATEMNPEFGVDVFKKPGKGRDQGAEAGSFFSEYLGIPTLLLRVSQPRDIKPECRREGFSEQIGFADGFQALLTSYASLAELNGYSEQPIAMERFRPNIVVGGEQLEAYDEDYWRAIRIGFTRFLITRACARCPVPNIDQTADGGTLPSVSERFVTKALQRSRSGIDELNGRPEVFFGQNLTHQYEEGSTLRIGDIVRVDSRASERNFIA